MSSEGTQVKKSGYLDVASALSIGLSSDKFLFSDDSLLEQPQSASNDTLSVLRNIGELKIESTTPKAYPGLTKRIENKTLDEILFDACAEVKIYTSKVSMHLRPGFREKLFIQLDQIHTSDDWDEDESPINQLSYESFIKWILLDKPDVGPGVGLSASGNFITAWTKGESRLTCEFFPDGKVMWIVSWLIDNEIENASGITSIYRLLANLAPYNPEQFFAR